MLTFPYISDEVLSLCAWFVWFAISLLISFPQGLFLFLGSLLSAHSPSQSAKKEEEEEEDTGSKELKTTNETWH
jgi:type III secretory pathway component EscV